MPLLGICALFYLKTLGFAGVGYAQLELSLAEDHKAAGGAGGTLRSCWNP